MQILFDNWHISVKLTESVTQNDNLSDKLTVEGELPDGYTSWSLLMRAGGAENSVDLDDIDGKPGVLLTSDMLPYGNTFYELQLRGECGETVKHSDIEYVFISEAIGGSGSWPAAPSGGGAPVRGTDYWTAEDIAEIKSYVDDAILGGAW